MDVPRIPDPEWMTRFLRRAEEEMRLKGFSPSTRRLYLGHLRRFYRARGEAHPKCTSEECRRWLLGLIDQDYSFSYVSQALSAIKFVHTRVLRCDSPVANIPRPRKGRFLPTVLSREEVKRLLAALRDPKHRAVVLVLYSAGLRVGEALRLRLEDIDSERGVILVRDGKGRKDRVVMLAKVTLEELRNYARVERPHHWLFPGKRRDRHMHARTVQRAVTMAARDAGIRKKVTPHTFRHNAECRIMPSGVVEGPSLAVFQPLLIYSYPLSSA